MIPATWGEYLTDAGRDHLTCLACGADLSAGGEARVHAIAHHKAGDHVPDDQADAS